MSPFVAKTVGWLIGSAWGQVAAVVVIGSIAFGGWTWKVARDAREGAMQRVLTETMQESSRRLRELNAVAAESAERQLALAAAEAERSNLLGKIDALSKANDGDRCLDASASLRLDGLRGRPPGARDRNARRPPVKPPAPAVRSPR